MQWLSVLGMHLLPCPSHVGFDKIACMIRDLSLGVTPPTNKILGFTTPSDILLLSLGEVPRT